MASAQVLYFGDQAVEMSHSLRCLCHRASSSPSLQCFLNEAVSALLREIATLPGDDWQAIPSFRSALDLVEICSGDKSPGVVLSTVVLCIAQLGDYIHRAEQDTSLLATSSSPSQRTIVGVCTGLLPAVVAGVATSLVELTSLARETVLVALRLGVHAHRRTQQIESSSESWAVAMNADSPSHVQSLIDEFHQTQSIPDHKHVYISADSTSGLTLSGPPSVLGAFTSSPELAKYRKLRLPILGAFHGPHLAEPDAAAIIGTSPLFSRGLRNDTTLVSPSSGSLYTGTDVNEIFLQAVDDIFQRAVHHGQAIKRALDQLAGSNATVSVFGPTNAEKTLRQALLKADLKGVEVRTSEREQEPGISGGGIAIVGMSGRFPGSEDVQGFWETLREGRDLHTTVPKDRFDVDLHCDPSGSTKNSTLSAFGCFIDKPGHFDNRLFNMSPREAAQTDPTQRLLLATTYEALEMAGYHNESTRRRPRIGTFMGLTTDDWREYNISQDIDMYYVTGGIRAFNSGRLNYHFKWDGPSYVIDTACSSSAAAIELAVASLQAGDCDMAIAGGANVMTGPNLHAGLSRAGFTSSTGSCKTFDDGADGYCRGDGVAVVVLKRLEDAVAQRDNIQGVIRGVGTNHSAHAPSITQPHAPTQKRLFAHVLQKAGLQPGQIGYIEMHGTGTQAGDATEMASVVSTFGAAAHGRAANNPLYVGGLKANIGHGEGVAGVASVVKALMMFREKAIPPHAGIKTKLNTKFPRLQDHGIRIAREETPFVSAAEPRRIR